MGMPIGNSRWCAGTAADVLHYFAGAIDKHTGSTIPVAGGVDLTFHEPLGVVGSDHAVELPAADGVVEDRRRRWPRATRRSSSRRRSPRSPRSASASWPSRPGIPEGVLQVVVGTGAEVGWRLVEHPDVRKVAFTGSTAVGKRIMAGCAEQVKRVTLELGGKSANIVFADADLEQAAAAAPGAVFDNSGQDCCARSRGSSSQRSVLDRFVELLRRRRARRSRVGDPLRPSRRRWARWPPPRTSPGCASLHATPRPDLDRRGARRARASGTRSWSPSTPIRRRRVCREEVFGPVVVVLPFDDEADAVRIANDTPTACPARSGRATSAGRCASPAAWRPARCRSTRTARCATARRSAGSSRAASAASTRWHVLDHYTELKNVFIAT